METIISFDRFTIDKKTPHQTLQLAINAYIVEKNILATQVDKRLENVLFDFHSQNSYEALDFFEAILDRLSFQLTINEFDFYFIRRAYNDTVSNFSKKLNELTDEVVFLVLEKMIDFNSKNETYSIPIYETLLVIKKRFDKKELPIENKILIQKIYDDSNNENAHNYHAQWRTLSDILNINDPINLMQQNIDANFGKGKLLKTCKFGFPLFENSPYKEYEEYIDGFIKDLTNPKSHYDVTKFSSYRTISQLDKEDIKNITMACLHRAAYYTYSQAFWGSYRLTYLFGEQNRKKLPHTEADIIFLYKGLNEEVFETHNCNLNMHFKAVEALVKKNGLSNELKTTLSNFVKKEKNIHNDKSLGKVITKINTLLNQDKAAGDVPIVLLNEGDEFGRTINKDIKELKDPSIYYEILAIANLASGGKPTKKFSKASEILIKKIEENKIDVLPLLEKWFNVIVKMELSNENQYYSYLIQANNQDTLKGLLWFTSFLPNPKPLFQCIYKLAIRCFQKIPMKGPAAAAAGNASIYALYSTNELEAISYLTKLRLKIKQKNTRSLIEKYIEQAATNLNVSSTTIEDMSVSNYGLTDGKVIYQFDDYQLHIAIERIGKCAQIWYKPDGKVQKTVPAFVKKDYAEKLKKIKLTVKEIQQMLTVQRDRLDRSYVQKASWSLADFEKYYLHHGLQSFIAKKLIWVAKNKQLSTSMIWNDGWKNLQNQTVDWLDEHTEISLWHPVLVDVQEVLQWRTYILDNQIIQPLKQAFREIYILTDAELNTRDYSNRMAAHFLKQHQFNSLTTLRNWKYSLLGAYDDGRDSETAYLKLPAYNLRAEFWINEVYQEDAYNDAGIWLYVATDQVRFYDNEQNIIRLVDVPKIIFSEIMRDVDLFVGVSSVGNDPQWQDNAGNAQQREYWQSYSFGNLTEVAKMRKTILEQILPKLKIAKISEIEGKFLKVKGQFTTYKIHIGSTNILMEPNDQYLCIVPSRKKDNSDKGVFLPFEGDRGLSILLSKAFLLAEDEKITDETIIRQLPVKN